MITIIIAMLMVLMMIMMMIMKIWMVNIVIVIVIRSIVRLYFYLSSTWFLLSGIVQFKTNGASAIYSEDDDDKA